MKKVNQKQYVPALKWIVKLLKKEKIKFNILGGLAAYVYGSKRIINDIDISMNYKDMKKLTEIAKKYVVEEPWNITSPKSLWKGYYMELNYKGIAIEIGASKNIKFFNKKIKKWENFPDGLDKSINKKVFGLVVPVMPRKNLIQYKKKLGRKMDLVDLKNLEDK